MRAAVFHGVGQPLSIESVPDPVPAQGELLVRVGASGICGTDLHLSQAAGLLPAGSVLGHEFAGEIVAVGREARGAWRPGQRVAVVPYLVCGSCHACLDGGDVLFCPEVRFTGFGELSGGYAEYVRAGSSEVVELPESVPDRIGATVEPLCVALQAVEHAEIPAGARVLVIGAGPIGLAVAQWARLRGAGHVAVSERAPGRLALAAEFGATAAIDPSREDLAEAFARETGGPPDVVFECVGVPGMIQLCVEQVRPKGQVVVVGVCMGEDRWQPGRAIGKSLTFRFSVGYRTRHFRLAVEMLARGRIQSAAMITREIGLREFPDAFESLKRPGRDCKVILEPGRGA